MGSKATIVSLFTPHGGVLRGARIRGLTRSLHPMGVCPKASNYGYRECKLCRSVDQVLLWFMQGRPVPCRAQIWWIRAVPNISVPCPDDPCRAKYFRAVPCLAVPGSWYQILVPRSWYQDLGTIFREKVKPITTPPDKVFKLSGR